MLIISSGTAVALAVLLALWRQPGKGCALTLPSLGVDSVLGKRGQAFQDAAPGSRTWGSRICFSYNKTVKTQVPGPAQVSGSAPRRESREVSVSL